MSIKLTYNSRLSYEAQQVCNDYWAYDGTQGFINHVETICHTYQISSIALFKIVAQCAVCLDDVCCDSCGSYCPVEVPADIRYMRDQTCWFCASCIAFSGGQVWMGR